MSFYSKHAKGVSLKEALFQGFAPDGSLYLPEKLPHFSPDQLKRLRGCSFLEVSIEIGQALFPDIKELPSLLEAAFPFPLPFIHLSDEIYLLELFHGPTLSFKDIGARLLAEFVRILKEPNEKITVLVATSGDTGSAVGQAFFNIPGVRVFILYPKGAVTPSQEKQFTTIGGNVTAVEVNGNFEACQELVKKSCLELPHVTTGNSINVIRLLAHSLPYFYASTQLDKPALFSIPCGNFGHLVAGLLAKRMGLPIFRFIGATNVNDEVPLFLHTGVFQPHAAYHSMAVSMDVGNPSNFPRLLELYDHSLEALRSDLVGVSYTDTETVEAIREVYDKTGYLLDPHSAIGFLGLKNYLSRDVDAHPGIFFATAHPAKFREALEPVIGSALFLPESLDIHKPKEALSSSSEFEAFKELLFSYEEAAERDE